MTVYGGSLHNYAGYLRNYEGYLRNYDGTFIIMTVLDGSVILMQICGMFAVWRFLTVDDGSWRWYGGPSARPFRQVFQT